MARLIEAIDADARPATRDDVTSLSAMLLAKAGIWKPNAGTPESKDFAIYVLGLAEAFSQFPTSIGWEAIHGGKGILAKLEYKPKPIDIGKFCTSLMQRRLNAKTMAIRHIAESKRRAAERREQATTPPIDYEARKRRTEEIMKGHRVQSMDTAKSHDDFKMERSSTIDQGAIDRRKAVYAELEQRRIERLAAIEASTLADDQSALERALAS